MDTMKKEIYIEARRLLESGPKEYYLCLALRSALRDITGMSARLPIETEEFFPEVNEMDDGVSWSRTGRIDEGLVGSTLAWWDAPWPEPRLRMIDYLLSR